MSSFYVLSLQGLTHPTVKNADGKYVPNFKYRYLLEDIPFGLLVMKGVAALAGVPTPTMDKVFWCLLVDLVRNILHILDIKNLKRLIEIAS